jgi:comEA protein
MVTPAQENIDSASEKTLRVNLNTANLEQLAELPGIGNSIAERIIKYRTETGLFKATDDLLSVKGIGKKKYEKLSGLITVQ